jgi:hypothetical protein
LFTLFVYGCGDWTLIATTFAAPSAFADSVGMAGG